MVMKNIHILPTDKPSRLSIIDSQLIYSKEYFINPQNIYITSDEEIKEGDWFYDGDSELCKYTSDYVVNPNGWNDNKKIILTTDQDLIKDGVQDIDDEFLEWFIKNPSCEEVKIEDYGTLYNFRYLILIPQEEQKQHLIDIMRGDEELGLYEEPKQDTLEEFIEREGYPEGHTQDIWETGVRDGVEFTKEQILQFLYSEITERRDYSASKMCEVVIGFIEQLNNK
jgi:hypothetical protein